jgi:hypothetical protein
MSSQQPSTDRLLLRARQVALILLTCSLAALLFGCEPQASKSGPVVNDSAAAANMPGGSGPRASGAAAATDTNAPKEAVPAAKEKK